MTTANPIKPKKSGVAGHIPTALELGELAINYGDGTSYSSNGSNVVQIGAGTIAKLNDVNVASPIPGQTLMWNGEKWANASNPFTLNDFFKLSSNIVAFERVGLNALKLSQPIFANISGSQVAFNIAESVLMPALVAGTDYAIYACMDRTLRADANFTAPAGYTALNSYKIGGFHYAPGSNAIAQAGGDSTPQINGYSVWDIKFRPACPDPRGMTLVANNVWVDIYLLSLNHITTGTSAYNVAFANQAAKPIIPLEFGGNGSSVYANFTWYDAVEILSSYGKRPPTNAEFIASAYGTTEKSSATVQTSTILVPSLTSKWGVIQSTGVMTIWGGNFGGPFGAGADTINTERGTKTNHPNASTLGGSYASGVSSGSRAADYTNKPSNFPGANSARGVAQHLIIA